MLTTILPICGYFPFCGYFPLYPLDLSFSLPSYFTTWAVRLPGYSSPLITELLCT